MIIKPNLIQGEGQRFQCLLPDFRLQLTLPYGNAMPAHASQFPLLFDIPFLIPPDLRHPERPIRIWDLAARTVSNSIFIIH